jgi:hypothetical protein
VNMSAALVKAPHPGAGRGYPGPAKRRSRRWLVSLLAIGACLLMASQAGTAVAAPAARPGISLPPSRSLPASLAAAPAPSSPAAAPSSPAAAVTPGLLEGVSCSGAAACTAVGETAAQSSQAERWNGTVWAGQRTPRSGQLMGVSCPSAAACTAVGFPSAALAWNGHRWARQHIPVPSGNSALAAVSCSTPVACTAVGYYYTHDDMQQLIWVAAWNGTTWARQPVPSPASTAQFRSEALEGVSCVSAGACVAVGYYAKAVNSYLPLIEAWNGTRWAIQPAATSGTATFTGLYGVTCRSAGACTAVGTISTGVGNDSPLAEHWDGTTWTVQPTPSPAGGILYSVSCASAAACIAVGEHTTSAGKFVALADRWNGTAWAVQRVAKPSGGTPVFGAVSCTAATACTAVGSRYQHGSTKRLTLAERWNGTRWAVQPT